MNGDDVLRKRLLELLEHRHAHMPFQEAVADFPERHINTKPPNVPYSFWQLVEHMRITQWDILDFIRNPQYRYLTWPDDYWPPRDRVVDKGAWTDTLQSFSSDLEELKQIVRDPATDFSRTIPWGEGQDLLREILVVADHNAYHIGELAILRQVVGAWPEDRAER